MRYDVEVRVDDRLVSGRKNGDFIVKVFIESTRRASLTNGPLMGWRETRRSSHSHCIASWRVDSTTGHGYSLPMPTTPGMRNPSLALCARSITN